MDDFLNSMTFASGDIGCECDECDVGQSAVPTAIRNAVTQHLEKKRKREEPTVFSNTERLYIRQTRELVAREVGQGKIGLSIWKFILPISGGDPIVEYRNNHRILYVKQMGNVNKSHLLSIGKGIIGSAAEEASRTRVNWNEDSAYLLPCSKGIACGWIHQANKETEKQDEKQKAGDDEEEDDNGDEDEDEDDDNNVIIYSLKVSPDTLQSMGDNHPEGLAPWATKMYELFQQCLDRKEHGQKKDDEENKADNGIQLSDEESSKVELIIAMAEGSVIH